MEYFDIAKQYSYVFIIMLYVALGKLYFNFEDSLIGLSVLFMMAVQITTSNATRDMQDNQIASDIRKMQNENEGLKKNLMQVYNMVRPIHKPAPSPHLPQQSSGGGVSVPPREIPVVSQNSSSSSSQMTMPPSDPNDTKPYA